MVKLPSDELGKNFKYVANNPSNRKNSSNVRNYHQVNQAKR